MIFSSLPYCITLPSSGVEALVSRSYNLRKNSKKQFTSATVLLILIHILSLYNLGVVYMNPD